MTPSPVRPSRSLLVVALFAASSAYALPAAAGESAVAAPADVGKQPARTSKDSGTATSGRSVTQAADQAASQPGRKRWIVLAE